MEYKLNISPFLKNNIKAQSGTNCWEGCCPCCDLCACNCLPLEEGDKICIEFSNLRFVAGCSDPPPTPPDPDACTGLTLDNPNPSVELTLTTGIFIGSIPDYILYLGGISSSLDIALGCDFYLDEEGATVCYISLGMSGTGICTVPFSPNATPPLVPTFFECTPIFTYITGPGQGEYPVSCECCPLAWDSITFTAGACPMPFTAMAANRITTQSKPSSFLKTNFTPKKKCNCKDKRKLII